MVHWVDSGFDDESKKVSCFVRYGADSWTEPGSEEFAHWDSSLEASSSTSKLRNRETKSRNMASQVVVDCVKTRVEAGSASRVNPGQM